MGKISSQSQARPIVLKLVDRYSKDQILKHTRNLKGSKISVSEQFPEKVRAKRSSLVPELKRQRGLGKTANIRVDTLYVNGKAVPSKETRYPIQPRQSSSSSSLSQPITLEKNHNKFQSLAAKVTTPYELANVKKQLLLIPDAPKANHIMYAYKLKDVIGYDEDGEYGAHTHLLKSLREKADTFVAVIRWSGPHLGQQRYDVISDMAAQAITSLDDDGKDSEEGEDGGETVDHWNETETW